MFKILTTPRKGVTEETALRVAEDAARKLGITIIEHVYRHKSRQLTLRVEDQDMTTLQRFTMTLREEHKTTFTSISAAKEA